MYLTEEDLILLVIKALIKKKEAKSDCGCSLKKEMDEIAMEDEMILPLSDRKSRRSLGVSGLVVDAPVFTSKTVVSSVLPDSPRNLGVKKSLVLPPSPSRMTSTLPPSPRVSKLSSLSYKPGSLPVLQKSPVASRTSLPTLSKLTQLN